MNNRWCIIATPRSGSNYLEEMLYLSICKQGNLTMKLGEILHRVIWSYSDSEGSAFKLDSLYDSMVRTNFRNDLLTKLESDTNIGAVVRVFVQAHHLPDIDYKNFIDNLKSLNFNFIHLTRNTSDSAISLSMAQNTGLWHRHIDGKHEVIDGNQNYANNPTIMNIPIPVVGSNYMDIKLHDYYNSKILKDLEHIIIRYENILEDCKSNNLLIEENTKIKKLYQTDYADLIENYEEIKTFYQNLING